MSILFHIARVAAVLAVAGALPALAKPISFAQGQTVMAEYGGAAMDELQYFYAPRYWWSAGFGRLTLTDHHGLFDREIVYLRGNLLAKRWNLPSAQANVFLWGGLGDESGAPTLDDGLVRNAGFQLDYETRRVYSSFKADLFEGEAFSHRLDTVQLGVAPTLHDYDRLAVWVVAQGRTYTGGVAHGTEGALLLRFFKGGIWVEAGVNDGGEAQAMLMFNF